METTTYPAALIAEETARILDGKMTWEDYKRASRSGSAFCLSRADRKAIFNIVLGNLPLRTHEQRRAALVHLNTDGLSLAYLTAWVNQ